MAHAYKLCMHSLYAVLVVGSIHIGAITVTATVSSSNDSLSFVAFFFLRRSVAYLRVTQMSDICIIGR